jgi:two-component system, cell cycle sensor histidine kinase and response regulator CckA
MTESVKQIIATGDQRRKSNREILEAFGYKVVEAIDGEYALEKYAGYEDLVDMLILDVIMPKKSGREVYNIVKKSGLI